MKIPAGVTTGNYLTLRGQGTPVLVTGSRATDRVDRGQEDEFERHDDDILFDVPIYSQAALGAELEVPTSPARRRSLSLRARKPVRFRACAARDTASFSSGKGVQLVRLTVGLPTSLSAMSASCSKFKQI